MNQLSVSRNSMLGILGVTVLFILTFSLIQLSPLLQIKSANQILEQSYWYPQKTIIDDPDQLRTVPFTPYEGPLSVGNLRGETWLKLKIQQSVEPITLMIGPAFTESIDVYQSLADGSWLHHEGGLQRSLNDRLTKTLSMTVPLVQLNGDPYQSISDVYVRVQSPTAFIQVKAYPHDEIIQYDNSLSISFGVYFGISTLVMALCLVLWIATGDKLWLDVVAYDSAFAFYATTQSGILYRNFPDLSGEWAIDLYVLSTILVSLAMCRFTLKALDLFEIKPFLRVFYWLGYAVCALSLGFLLFDLNQYALLGINLMLMSSCVWGYLVVLNVRGNNEVLRRTYQLLMIVYSSIPLMYLASVTLKLPVNDTILFLAAGQNNFFTLVMILLLFGFRAWQHTLQNFALQTEKEVLSARLETERTKLEEASGFLSMIVHELKNPLNFIRLASSNLASEFEDNQAVRKVLSKVQNSVLSIDNILERSLQVDAKDIGALVIEKQTCNVALLIKGVKEELDHTDRINVMGLKEVDGLVDIEVLSLIVRNLLENAVKYSAEGSEIELLFDRNDQLLRIKVLNLPGKAGYPDPEQLFRKFYRSPQALHISGSGLGLYWVREVVRMMKGQINYSRVGERICFELWIPS